LLRLFFRTSSLPLYVRSSSSADLGMCTSSTSLRISGTFSSCFAFIMRRFVNSSSYRPTYVASSSAALLVVLTSATSALISAMVSAFSSSCTFILLRLLINTFSLPL